jgi:hypothetical protein
MLHILLDSFAHRGMFAIQLLWPASSIHLDGIPWETGWSLAATCGTLAGVCCLLWHFRRVRRSLAGGAGVAIGVCLSLAPFARPPASPLEHWD